MKFSRKMVVTVISLGLSLPVLANGSDGSGSVVNGSQAMMPATSGQYPMMNPQMIQQIRGGQGMPMMNRQMMPMMMGNQYGQGMNPQSMHQMMGEKHAHMKRMEGLMISIDASLKELVALQKK